MWRTSHTPQEKEHMGKPIFFIIVCTFLLIYIYMHNNYNYSFGSDIYRDTYAN